MIEYHNTFYTWHFFSSYWEFWASRRTQSGRNIREGSSWCIEIEEGTVWCSCMQLFALYYFSQNISFASLVTFTSDISNCIFLRQNVNETYVPESLLASLVSGTREFPPVCAIIGGILGQVRVFVSLLHLAFSVYFYWLIHGLRLVSSICLGGDKGHIRKGWSNKEFLLIWCNGW